MLQTTTLDLFAGIPVADYAAARTWYERLLGSEPTFFPHDTEAVWELAAHRYVYIMQQPDHADHRSASPNAILENRERPTMLVEGERGMAIAESATQHVYYVVFLTTTYRSFAEARAEAAADIAAHLARSKELHEHGLVVMAGAFLDRPEEPLSTMAVLTSRAAAEDFVRGDPFVLKGKVSAWHIREWANMFA